MDCEDLLSGPSGVDSATARTGRASTTRFDARATRASDVVDVAASRGAVTPAARWGAKSTPEGPDRRTIP